MTYLFIVLFDVLSLMFQHLVSRHTAGSYMLMQVLAHC